ncbi:hypothetical protein GN316_06525 [Xylophilus sp. Kf1]|nr:hypothetical protein [Xylophilus sp. Kf1]
MSATLNYDPTDPDKMRLPAGIACCDCGHIRRCKAIYGHTETDTYCDWSPSRFFKAPAAAPAAAEGAVPSPVRDDRGVLHLMVQQGGAFVHHIARAWLSADPENRARLAAAFADVYDRYAVQAQAIADSRGEVAA